MGIPDFTVLDLRLFVSGLIIRLLNLIIIILRSVIIFLLHFWVLGVNSFVRRLRLFLAHLQNV